MNITAQILSSENLIGQLGTSLAADPPLSGMHMALRGRRGEGLANIAIHSFQLTNQIFTAQDFKQ